MWKNIVQQDTPQMTTWRMSIACWIPKVTYTHPKYVYLLLFPLQQWLHKCTTMSCYMYIACLVSYKCRELNKLNWLFSFSQMIFFHSIMVEFVKSAKFPSCMHTYTHKWSTIT